jgi:diaminopimelate epimerase
MTADVRMEMYNADGSRGEMCGNGIRCVARLHYETSGGLKNPIAVETDCGVKTIALRLNNGHPAVATVDMGEPILEGRDIPVDRDGRVVDYPLEVAGRIERITAVSMGNPHCVVFVNDDHVFGLDTWEFERLGLACGTGACAALVAAVLTDRANRGATVELRGGNLEIEWRRDGTETNHIFMTGEAVEVFRGELELSDDELVAADPIAELRGR